MLNIENWWRGRLKWFWRMWGVNGWRSRRLALVTWDIGHGSGWRQRGDSSLPTCDLPFSSLRRKPIVSQPKGSSSRNLLLSKRSDVIIVGQPRGRAEILFQTKRVQMWPLWVPFYSSALLKNIQTILANNNLHHHPVIVEHASIYRCSAMAGFFEKESTIYPSLWTMRKWVG